VSGGENGAAATMPGGEARMAEAPVRLNVEQASYAYHGHGQSAPDFTLAATSVVASQREVVTILGPNASGKSTLLKLIAGSLDPLSGRVELEGFEISRLDARTRAQKIAMVNQESALLFPARAGDYVLQGRHPYRRMLRFETEEDVQIAEEALAQVGATHLRDRWMHEISGGEKQRVILARALAQQPILLLLDEPTLHLDIGAQVELLERLRQLAAESRYTVIVVTHELSLAAEFADQVVLLNAGKCLRVGTPADVYRRDLLEQVFEAPLDVDIGPEGRPRVYVRGGRTGRGLRE